MPCGCPFGVPIVSRFSHFYASIFDARIYERKLRIYGATQGILIRFPANRLSAFLFLMYPASNVDTQSSGLLFYDVRVSRRMMLNIEKSLYNYRILSIINDLSHYEGYSAYVRVAEVREFPGTLAPQRMSRIHWHIFMTITRAEFIHVLVSRRFWNIPKCAAFILVYELYTYVYCS